MEIKITNVKVNVLTATEGCYIYRKNEELQKAYFTKTVFLGQNDSPDNYAEITEEQYNEIISQRKEAEETETAEKAEETETAEKAEETETAEKAEETETAEEIEEEL